MADPTQNDEKSKSLRQGVRLKPVSPREEVSAADLLSLWGGGERLLQTCAKAGTEIGGTRA